MESQEKQEDRGVMLELLAFTSDSLNILWVARDREFRKNTVEDHQKEHIFHLSYRDRQAKDILFVMEPLWF